MGGSYLVGVLDLLFSSGLLDVDLVSDGFIGVGSGLLI